jgi:hypothetical protein
VPFFTFYFPEFDQFDELQKTAKKSETPHEGLWATGLFVKNTSLAPPENMRNPRVKKVIL